MEPDWQDSMTRDCPKGVYARITPKETNGASAVGVLRDSILPDLATRQDHLAGGAKLSCCHKPRVSDGSCHGVGLWVHTYYRSTAIQSRSAVTLTGPDRPGPFLLVEDVKAVTPPNRHYVSYRIRQDPRRKSRPS